ncbi:hypothetical protein [Microbacterium soli]|uniref:Phage tail protein n=1 Tax=Microbacterium soli TaxID=446075 RepID=A0ABP7NK08_9MICO
MATIDVKPIVLRDCKLTISLEEASADYEKHVSGVTFTPSSGTVNWNGLSPDASFTFPTATTWGAQLDYAQDWETASSLSRYLYDNEGKQVTMLFEPKAGGLGWEVDVFIAPGSIGGQVNTVATSTVTLGVVGKPRPVPAV